MEIYVADPQKKYHPYFLGDGCWGVDRLDFHESLNLESTTWVKVNMLFRRRIWWWESVARCRRSWVHGPGLEFMGSKASASRSMWYLTFLLCRALRSISQVEGEEEEVVQISKRIKLSALNVAAAAAAGTLPNVVDIWALPNMMPSHKLQENQHPILLLQGLRCSCSCWLLLHTPPLPQKT